MREETIRTDESKDAIARMSAAIENAPQVLGGEFEVAVVDAFSSCTGDGGTFLRVPPGSGK
jgi:hypothetical protein